MSISNDTMPRSGFGRILLALRSRREPRHSQHTGDGEKRGLRVGGALGAGRVMAYGAEIFCALFVLFLIASIQRLAAHSVELDLVDVGAGVGLVRPESPHLLQVLEDGTCFLDGEPVALDQLESVVQDGRPVVLACEFDETVASAIETLYLHRVPVLLAVEPTATQGR